MAEILFYLLVSIAATAGVLRYASHRLIDMPNHRSSHAEPTPRGGGLGFVLVFALFCLQAFWRGELQVSDALAFLFGGFGMALLGGLDDHFSLNALHRLLGQIVFGAMALFWLGGVGAIYLLPHIHLPAALTNALALFAIVGMVNAFNFMDGINGFAALQAIFFFAAAGYFFSQTELTMLSQAAFLLAVMVAGFLCFNFPRALIFMGDAGSFFLGGMISLYLIVAYRYDRSSFAALLMMMAFFVSDATLTLIKRFLKREPLFQAHRTHAYQRLAIRFDHTKTTLFLVFILISWLFPLALCVNKGYIYTSLGLLLAYLPLWVIWAIA